MSQDNQGLNYDRHWLDIANRALTLIGAETLSSFEDGTTGQKLVEQLLPSAVTDVYSQNAWIASRKYAQLAPEASLDITGNYLYKYPTDFAKLESVTCEEEWEAESRGILTKSPNVVIGYSALPTLATDIPPILMTLVVYKLASLLAMPLTHSSTLLQSLQNEYNVAYSKAIMTDIAPNPKKLAGNTFYADER